MDLPNITDKIEKVVYKFYKTNNNEWENDIKQKNIAIKLKLDCRIKQWK